MILIFSNQIILGQTSEEKIIAEKAVSFYRAAVKRDWKTLYLISAKGTDKELPVAKEWIEYWTKKYSLILENPKLSNIYIGESDASLRITFHYSSNVFSTEDSLLPNSYDFSFQKIKNEWKIKSFEPTANLFINRFIYATDLAQEKELIEREHDYLSTWESLDILNYADQDWTKDAGTIPRFKRLFEAVMDNSNNQIIKAEAYWNLGKNFLSTNNYESADASFTRGLELGKEAKFEYAQFLNLTGLSEVRVYKKEYEKAQQIFNIAFSIHSNRLDAYNNAVWSSSRIGNAFFNTKNYDTAIKIYQQGFKVAENFKDGYWQIKLLKDTGDCYFQLKNYNEAQNWYKKSLILLSAPGNNQIYQDSLPEIYKIIGKTYQKTRQFNLAIEIYKKNVDLALIKKEPQKLTDAYDTLAKFYASQNDSVNTIKTYNTLWTKLLELKAASDLTEAIRDDIPVIIYNLGQIKEAEDLLNKWMLKGAALIKGKNLTNLLTTKAAIQFTQLRFRDAEATLRQIILVPDGLPEDKAFGHIGIAFIYAMRGQFEKGFEEFEQFEQLMLQSPDKETVKYTKFIKLLVLIIKNRNNSEEVSSLLQKIIADNQDDKYILAITYLIKGFIQIYRIAEKEEKDGKDDEFLNIEQYRVEIESIFTSIDKSLSYLEESDEISQTITMIALLFKGAIYYSTRDFDKAVEHINKASNIVKNFIPPLLPILKAFEGHIFVESKKWEKARDVLNEAIIGFEKENRNVTGGLKGKFLISTRNQAFYKEMVRTQLALNDIDEALIYSERTKGGIVLELNEIRKSNELDPLPEKISKESPKNTNVLPNRKKLVPSWKKFEDFIPGTQIYIATDDDDSESAETDENNYNIPVLKIEQTKTLLPDRDTALLEFFVDEDKIYLFILTDESEKSVAGTEWRKNLKWQVFVIEDEPTLRFQIGILQSQIKERKMIYKEYCQYVYDLLIKPVEQHLKDKLNWIIIPDDFIWNVPFQALQSQPDRFLIYDHNISFATSLNVLAQMREVKINRKQKTSGTSGKDILAVGIPTSDPEILKLSAALNPENNIFIDDEVLTENQTNSERPDNKITLPSLPGAADEVQGISDTYGPNRVELRIAPAETKAQFIKEAGNYRIVHVATHGIIDNNNPMNSSLVFGKPSINSKVNRANLENERFLTTKEILEMQMSTNLIVLSACDTGSGTSVSGEGLIGLSWAFSAAGVPTIVSSQWTVNDASTAILMREFHKNLWQTEIGNTEFGNISQALRKSTLFLMQKDKKYLHPYYWASFITIGEP